MPGAMIAFTSSVACGRLVQASCAVTPFPASGDVDRCSSPQLKFPRPAVRAVHIRRRESKGVSAQHSNADAGNRQGWPQAFLERLITTFIESNSRSEAKGIQKKAISGIAQHAEAPSRPQIIQDAASPEQEAVPKKNGRSGSGFSPRALPLQAEATREVPYLAASGGGRQEQLATVLAPPPAPVGSSSPSRRQWSGQQKLDVSGPVAPYPPHLRNFWYPVAFASSLDESTLIPLECFEEPWVLFRGPDGQVGCIADECAHRACPLSLGTVVDGRVKCPYHGWEFGPSGACEAMPSTKLVRARVKSLPCREQQGMVWIWPGEEAPAAALPELGAPAGYTTHAELVLELPVEHGLLMENLLDLAHAPFTHTATFAKGWAVPSLVRFKSAAAAALSGHWDPYPIAMEFQPPCMVLSTIGLAKPGQLDGTSAEKCSKHLFQLHSCLPASRGKTRLLYRMALDFAGWAKWVPFIGELWKYLANQVLAEDLRLVLGQQDRMQRGANVWAQPVAYDSLGVAYRRWRNKAEAGGGEEDWQESPRS
eukprot:TRINITY_DN1977_c0_g1_i1.p1 TRINITY_DN1977_c0_g1~~TRINITY_DN1977_c0_g1_i1.p1  ORF type:complete len:537 (-),score=81.89 TRINITY_DN1977_c0_g1_i1:1085-2695(-)